MESRMMSTKPEAQQPALPSLAEEPTAQSTALGAPRQSEWAEKHGRGIRSGIRAGFTEPKLPRGQGASTVRRDFTGPELPRRGRRGGERRADDVHQARSSAARAPFSCRGADRAV